MPAQSLLHGALHFDRHQWKPWTAFLRATGVAVPLLISALFHQPALGVLGGLGALYVGSSSFGGVFPARLRRMILTAAATALLTGVASAVSSNPLQAAIAAAVGGFALALFGSINAGLNVVAIQAACILAVVSGVPEMSANPWGNAGLVLAGGMFQTILLSLMQPVNPVLVERVAVAETFEGLAQFLEAQGTEDADQIPNSAPFLEARERLDEAFRYGYREEHTHLQHLMRTAETIRAALVAYMQAERRLGPGFDGARARAGFAAEFHSIAGKVRQGKLDYEECEFSLNEAGVELTGSPLDHWKKMICGLLNDLRTPSADVVTPVEDQPEPRTWRSLISSKMLRGLAFGHSIRYGLAFGLATAISQWSRLDHSYWFPLTVAIVLRPDYASTVSRGLGRAIGTIAGVVVASLITLLLHPGPNAMLALVVAATWLAYASFQSSYTAFAFSITLFVVFSVAASGLSERQVGEVRVILTITGVAFAIFCTWVWPIWQSRKVRFVLAEAFDAQAAYGVAVSAMRNGQPESVAEALRHRGRTLRIEAEKIITAAKVEPSWGRKQHLEGVEEEISKLAEGAADMLAAHACYVGAQKTGANIPSEISERLESAIATARARATLEARG